MPAGNRRGPLGRGPMTGRGLGFCGGYDSPGYTKGGFGRGRGFGRGFGRGYGRGFGFGRYAVDYYNPAPISKKEEENYLKNEIQIIEEELKTAKERLKELENKE